MKNLLLASLALIMLSLFSCEKDEENDEVLLPSNEITAEYYFTGTINSEKLTFQYMKNGYACGASESAGNQGSTYYENQGSKFQKGFGSGQSISFEILKRFPNSPSSEEKDDMFVLGDYEYGSNNSNGKNGAIVTYMDLDGVIWSSEYGPGEQTGSSFKLVEHIPNGDQSYLFARNISKVQFSCKLYNEEGTSINATDCELRGFTVLN